MISEWFGYCIFDKPASSLASKIKFLRCYLMGMSVNEFAQHTCLNSSSIISWENEKHKPNDKSIRKIALICSIEFEYFRNYK